MRRNARGWWAFGGGNVVLVIGAVVLILVPVQAKGIVMAGLIVGASLYVMLVSWGLKPKFTSINLYVDEKGVWANDAPLLARRDIADAQIRRPVASQELRITRLGTISLPAYPLTVEISTNRGGQVSIVPDSDQAGAAILTALGFPVKYAPDYQRAMSFWRFRSPQ
jgi:hypothetical protein